MASSDWFICLWVCSMDTNGEEVGCLRCSVAPYPLSPHFPFSDHRAGDELVVHDYEITLRELVIALASFLGFGMVLLGKELELEGWLLLISKELLDDEELERGASYFSL
ncbi:hypothetical protein Tco_0190536 [Tanacetum coccineum]